MRFTKYGQELAAQEAMPEIQETGASAHAKACAYDTGTRVVLTGRDAHGKRFRREALSVYGAYMQATALWAVERAWHVREDGTRRLVFSRL